MELHHLTEYLSSKLLVYFLTSPKHAMRLLRAGHVTRRCGPRPGRRIYDEAVREALIVIWEASDRICGKRLRPLLPILVEAMERHGHLARSQQSCHQPPFEASGRA